MVLATDSTGFCEMKIISICKHIDAIKQQGIHRRIYPSKIQRNDCTNEMLYQTYEVRFKRFDHKS
jgi:hypothetical protein